MQPMGRLSMHSKCLVFFLLSFCFGGGGEGGRERERERGEDIFLGEGKEKNTGQHAK
jgi:hypothetical protein